MAEDASEEPAALEAIEFPVPRRDSVASVLAAQEYIHDRNGATLEELVGALEPVENHRIGVSAVQALELLNDPEEYRDWWWSPVWLRCRTWTGQIVRGHVAPGGPEQVLRWAVVHE